MSEPATNNQDNPPLQVSRLGVHLPTFEPSDAELWFAIADRSFDAAGITSEQTKFSYAAAHLGMTHGLEVKDLIICPPTINPYTHLKEEFKRRLGTSQSSKTRKLLEHEIIGDQKPSQFMRRLKDLGGTAVGEDVIRTIWLGRLPSLIQAILAAHEDLSLDRLATLADSIADTTRQTALSISEIKPNLPQSQSLEVLLTQKMIQLQEQITKLQLEIGSINLRETQHRGRSNQRSRSSSRNRYRSNSNSRYKNESPLSGICWYHWQYGTRATKCKQPCSFSQSSEN